jgi:hypothetical protein
LRSEAQKREIDDAVRAMHPWYRRSLSTVAAEALGAGDVVLSSLVKIVPGAEKVVESLTELSGAIQRGISINQARRA